MRQTTIAAGDEKLRVALEESTSMKDAFHTATLQTAMGSHEEAVGTLKLQVSARACDPDVVDEESLL